MQYFDLSISLAFSLTIISAIICVVYGAVNWNKGANDIREKTVEHWAQEEHKVVEVL